MKEFTESMRYEYDLTSHSLVMDVGAHRGTFAQEILKKYGCHIRCYEPVKVFFDELWSKLQHAPGVSLNRYGLGGASRVEKFHVKGDMTGLWADGPEEEVTIMSISDEMRSIGAPGVDLLKINIEGGEYELLEAILDHKLVGYFRDIQVQFHGITALNPEMRRAKIRERLEATHHLTYDCPFIWENWRRTK